jgi:hypothetical protein
LSESVGSAALGKVKFPPPRPDGRAARRAPRSRLAPPCARSPPRHAVADLADGEVEDVAAPGIEQRLQAVRHRARGLGNFAGGIGTLEDVDRADGGPR